MDKIDRNILKLLQEDATLSTADIAESVGLSTTPCWRRIQRLEESGVIRKKVAAFSRQAESGRERLRCRKDKPA